MRERQRHTVKERLATEENNERATAVREGERQRETQ